MWAFAVICALFAVITSLILPWVNYSNIGALRDKIVRLQAEIERLKKAGQAMTMANMPPLSVPARAIPAVTETTSAARTHDARTQPSPEDDFEVTEESAWGHVASAARQQQARQQTSTPSRPRQERSFEQIFGGQAFVWLGGIALALAGFFMVKYSIETGLLSPAVRVTLGIIFGFGMLAGGAWVRNQPRFANGARIGQALSGAGIADLYACFFAATSLYDLVPPFLGFFCMAAVTAGAVLLSLQHGMPIAILGMAGGFLTPALMKANDPHAPLLFLYLYVVLAGMMVLIRRQHWQPLAIPAVIAAFLWVAAWLFGGNFAPGDTLWLGLFLLAVSGTVVATSRPDAESSAPGGGASKLDWLTLGGAMLLMSVIGFHSGFGVMEWVLFGMLTAGGIGLAFFDQKQYGFVPWLSMGVAAVMLLTWNNHAPQEFAWVLVLFAGLHIGSGWALQSRSPQPLLWAGLTAATGIGYFVLGYFVLRHTPLGYETPLLWGLMALGLAALGTYALQKIMQDVPETHPQKQHLLAIYAAAVTAFISLGLSIELKREFLSVAFAAEVLALAWINSRVTITQLRRIAAATAAVFGFLLMPQILLLIQLTAFSLVEARLHLQDGIPIVDWPLFQLGLPALCFFASAVLLRRQKDDRLVRSLETAAVALLGVMGYYLTRHAFHIDENVLFVKAGFIERGVITNIIFAYGLVCLWAGRHFARHALSMSGLTLAGIALFRLGYFDFIAYNPLWAAQKVGEWPIVNALLLTYGLPILWLWRTQQELPQLGKTAWRKYCAAMMLLSSFALLSLNVRQCFHGAYLNTGGVSNGEIYAYSAAWLSFGIGLLLLGVWRQDRMTRTASLIVLLLTVGKVFLYDASELTGLWRVFSFFALGLSLLGLSWFYAHFVFGRSAARHRTRSI